MKKYFICNNRYCVYCVYTNTNNVWIYDTVSKNLVVKLENVIKIFPGIAKDEDDSEDYGPVYKGNSILVETNKPMHYVYIGHDIYSFTTKEKIIKYVSNIGNNMVPYPYAKTKTDTYLMLEKKIIPNKELIDPTSPYTYYYANKNQYKNQYKDFKIKLIKNKYINPKNIYPMYFYLVHNIDIDDVETNEVKKYFSRFKPV
jgi:hypothetical protein